MKRNLWPRILWSAFLILSLGLLFLLYGPPSTASKAVVETYPIFSTTPQRESLTLYLEEFNRLRTNQISRTRQPAQFLGGTVLRRVKLGDVEVVLTHGTNSWTDQKLHYQLESNANWSTIRAPAEGASVVHILKPASRQRILLNHDKGLSVYDLRSGKLEQLLSTQGLLISPDRRWASTYEIVDEFGHYSLVIIDLDNLQIRKLFSFWEADPGSGISFHSNWSADSKALEFYGDVLLVNKVQDTHSAPIRKVRYLYLAERGELHDLSGVP